MRGPAARRAVITGIGAVAPGEPGVKPFWELLTAGRTATRPLSLFDASGYRSRVAAECDFDPIAAGLSEDQAHSWDRATQFAVVAAREALDDSGALGDADPVRVGVTVGTACGLTSSLDARYPALSDAGRRWLIDEAPVGERLYDYFIPSSMARELAWLADAQGPVGVVSSGCTSGIDAVGHAAALIEDGAADIMIAGASEAPITPLNVACFDAEKATTSRNDSPETASRPFDLSRDGFVLGEGSAFVVLEESGYAARRGARDYAEVAAHATRSNAYHMTGLRDDGAEMAEAIRVALHRARIDRSQIGYINAHGSSTRQNDRHETAAFKASLGPHAYTTPVSSIKSMVGHSLGAIGALEMVACALVIEHSVIPPTANLRTPDPQCDLDYVPLAARQRRVNAVLSVASGFGGFQSAIVLTRPGWRAT